MNYEERLAEIVDCSNGYQTKFYNQENICGELELLIKATNCFRNKTTTLSNSQRGAQHFTEFIYAVPILENFFFTQKTNKEEVFLYVFVSPQEAQNYKDKKGCEYCFVRFNDILDLIDALNVDRVQFYFNNGNLTVPKSFIEYYIQLDFFMNINTKSNYSVSEVESDYSEAIKIYNESFKRDSVKKMWLFHIKEELDKNEPAENNEYELEYDVLIAEAEDNDFIVLREKLQSVICSTNKFVIKTILSSSLLAAKLFECGGDNIKPFYKK